MGYLICAFDFVAVFFCFLNSARKRRVSLKGLLASKLSSSHGVSQASVVF